MVLSTASIYARKRLCMSVETSSTKTIEVQRKNIISQLQKDELPVEKVILFLQNESELVRSHVCLSISRRADGQNQLIGALQQAAKDPDNITYTMGKRTVDLAIVALLAIKSCEADSAVKQIVNNWSQDDRFDVLSWAKRLDLMSQTDLSTYYENQSHIRSKLDYKLRG